MARTLDSAVVTQIQNESMRLAHVVKLGFSTPIYLTNHSKNLSFNSDTYVADGQLEFLNDREETGRLEYTNISLVFKNYSDTLRTNLKSEDYVGTEVIITTVFLDADELITASYQIFKGRISSANLIEKNNESFATVEIASHWRDWESKKGRTFTVASQNSVYANDRGLDYAHRTRENLEWGQA